MDSPPETVSGGGLVLAVVGTHSASSNCSAGTLLATRLPSPLPPSLPWPTPLLPLPLALPVVPGWFPVPRVERVGAPSTPALPARAFESNPLGGCPPACRGRLQRGMA